jgi:hypothetical protein
MIHVSVEMWPQGDRRQAYHLGTAFIANIGGTDTTGKYEVRLMKSPHYARTPGIWKRATIEGFPRKRLGPWDLLLRGLAACIAPRNPGAAAIAETGDVGSAPAQALAEAWHLSQAFIDIAVERDRQVEEEGWTAAHDDAHADGEMARAAVSYIKGFPEAWPWHSRWWKPKDERRNLVRAAALIVAEIERLDRAACLTAQEAAGS